MTYMWVKKRSHFEIKCNAQAKLYVQSDGTFDADRVTQKLNNTATIQRLRLKIYETV